jgi:hypothetical protein
MKELKDTYTAQSKAACTQTARAVDSTNTKLRPQQLANTVTKVSGVLLDGVAARSWSLGRCRRVHNLLLPTGAIKVVRERVQQGGIRGAHWEWVARSVPQEFRWRGRVRAAKVGGEDPTAQILSTGVAAARKDR